MNNFLGIDTRNRRNLSCSFPTTYVPVANYSTNARTKESMNDTYNSLLNNLHVNIPDPLKKNLADSVITEKDIKNMTKPKDYTVKEVEKPAGGPTSDLYPKIKNYISGVINVMGALFQWRESSPSTQYYDCFEDNYFENSDGPLSGSSPWQSAGDVQNKSDWQQSMYDNNAPNWKSELFNIFGNRDSSFIIPNTSMPFECGSVDVFEDAVSSEEQCIGDTDLDYDSPNYQEQLFNSYASNVKTELNKETMESVKDTPPEENKCDNMQFLESTKEITQGKTKVENEIINELCLPQNNISDSTVEPPESITVMSQVHVPSELQNMELMTDSPNSNKSEIILTTKIDVVLSCEDKINMLKARLKPRTSRRKENNDETVSMKTQDSKEEESIVETDNNFLQTNNTQLTEDSTKSDTVKDCTEEDNEIVTTNKENVVSTCEDKLNKLKALLKLKCISQKKSAEANENTHVDNVPKIVLDTTLSKEIDIPTTSCKSVYDTFNEISGKFCSSSMESDDSFQIVFSDDAKPSRCRLSSECESEDSFIVFEDSPDSCYTSEDVFGEGHTSPHSDAESSDSDDDSGWESKLCPNFSRTFEDLTDLHLYDELDGAAMIGDHYKCNSNQLQNEGIKLDKDKPHKKVRFSSAPPKVHVMRVWAFAARQARIGEWEQHARDRERFKSRINNVEMAISWVLKPQHRKVVMFQRFQPWWNKQKREEQEKKRLEEEMKQQEQVESLVQNIGIEKSEETIEKQANNDLKQAKESDKEDRQQETLSGYIKEVDGAQINETEHNDIGNDDNLEETIEREENNNSKQLIQCDKEDRLEDTRRDDNEFKDEARFPDTDKTQSDNANTQASLNKVQVEETSNVLFAGDVDRIIDSEKEKKAPDRRQFDDKIPTANSLDGHNETKFDDKQQTNIDDDSRKSISVPESSDR